MSDLAFTARLPFARLTRSPRAWAPPVAWAGLAIVSALVLRRNASTGAIDALEAIFGPLALPLLSFAIVGAALGGDGLARATRPYVAFGASPLEAALSTVGVAVLSSALVTGVLGALVAALSHGSGHGPGDPSLARDALTSAWVTALGGAAYASLFSFGASFGKRGIGRPIALGVDWVFGAGTGVAGFLAPRAHVRSLLGGEAVMSLSGHVSALVLVALVLLFGALAAWRARSV